jgi:DNA end-binding protein Ku
VPSSEELELGAGLIEKLSSENFEPEAYRDEYRNRMLALIDEKAKGREITRSAESGGTRPGHRSHGGSTREHENS